MNKEKEKKCQEELAKLEEKKFPDTESGRLLKEKRIESLTNKYARDKEFRKRSLDDYLASLESTHKNAMQLAKILSGDN